MCAVSAVGDYWSANLPQQPYYPVIQPIFTNGTPEISRAEFDALKKDIEALKELLAAAKKFDAATGQPDCETDEKVELIRKLAKLVGVSFDGILA